MWGTDDRFDFFKKSQARLNRLLTNSSFYETLVGDTLLFTQVRKVFGEWGFVYGGVWG